MNLETYAPAASLVLLVLVGLVAFVRVRALIKRYGLSELNPEPAEAVKAEPWWTAHLDDYTAAPPPAPVQTQDAVAQRWPELKLEEELQSLEANLPVSEVPIPVPRPRTPVPQPPIPVPVPPPRRRRESPAPPRPKPEPEPAPVAPPATVAATEGPRYEMTAAVELWFGDSCVAVRPGSDTDARFQRFAAVLLDDLRSSRRKR
ncbi:MAG: hypothetical protein RQ731_00310 [Anaerosomatales bacterium]|nr:hypothetical protein [Anaerosomatales bacterium]MDT8433194.1 hypothetical protein [Anaerosomatales bacterium]